MSIQDAIQTYRDLLTDAVAAESEAHLEQQQRQRGLFFGDRYLCTVLRPRFMTADQFRTLQSQARALLRIFDKTYQIAMTEASFRTQFGLSGWEEDLLQHDPGFRDPSPTSRLDTFFVPDHNKLWLTEYNAETPAAPAYQDALTEVFYGLPIMRAFARRYEVRPLPARHGVLYALLDAHQQWRNSHEKPHIAILDWREVPTYSEFVLFEEYFKSHGLPCVIADPREVEYRHGQLFAGDFPVTLVYKRVLLSELVNREGLHHPVIQAVRDRAVCMVNPFRCKLMHKKASLAILSDERNVNHFTADEHAVIAAHVPWTRRVEERHTVYHGQQIDLIPFVLDHRERLVLKANDEYGGKGITLGWETLPATWERVVLTALEEPSVVQERVTVPSETYPSLVDGRVQWIDRMLDTNPFIVHGDNVEGCLTRLSTAALMNVSAGGGSTVPTVIVEKR